MRITNWFGSLAGVEVGVMAGLNGSSAPNPPSLTPSWGALDTLWLAVYGGQDDNASVNTWPTNFDDNQAEQLSEKGGGFGAEVAICSREFNGTVLDPGVFAISTGESLGAQTIAIRPAEPVGLPISLLPTMQRRSPLLRM